MLLVFLKPLNKPVQDAALILWFPEFGLQALILFPVLKVAAEREDQSAATVEHGEVGALGEMIRV